MARGSRSCWQVGQDGDYPCFPAVPACSSLACTFPWTKKIGPAALPCYRGAATRVRSRSITIRSFVQERKSGARRAGRPANHAPAAPVSPAVAVGRSGRQVTHLRPGGAGRPRLDACDRADQDARFPAAPHVPFLASAAQSSGAGNFPCGQKARSVKTLLRTQVDARRFTRPRTPGRSFF